jgi:hypothetical protein
MCMALSIMVFGLCLCTPVLFAQNDHGELAPLPTRPEYWDFTSKRGARSRAHIVDVGRGPAEVEIVEGHDFNRYFTSTSSDGVRAVEMSQKQEY